MADFLLASMKRKCPDQMVYEPLSDFALLSQIKRVKNQDGELGLVMEDESQPGSQGIHLQMSEVPGSSSSVVPPSELSTNMITQFDHVSHGQLLWSGNMATVVEERQSVGQEFAAAGNRSAVVEIPVTIGKETDAMIDDGQAGGDLMEVEDEGQRGADERPQQWHQTNRPASALWSGFF